MKIALVTGAYKGLGLEWCRQLAKNGFEVVLTARTIEKANKAAMLLKQEGLDVYPAQLDTTNEKEIIALKNSINDTYGKLDLLINNAAVNPKDYLDQSRMAKTFYLQELDANELLHVFHVNSISPLLMVKHFRPLFKQSLNPLVMNVSSWLSSVSQLNFGGHYGYVGSKNLLNVFNKLMALELKADEIICINFNPGWVQTDMGGKKASFTTAQSVSNILQHVMPSLTIDDTGKFFNYDGKEHPW